MKYNLFGEVSFKLHNAKGKEDLRAGVRKCHAEAKEHLVMLLEEAYSSEMKGNIEGAAGAGIHLGFPGGSDGKESACNVRDPGLIPGWEGPLEKGMATYSGILAWGTPWAEGSTLPGSFDC